MNPALIPWVWRGVRVAVVVAILAWAYSQGVSTERERLTGKHQAELATIKAERNQAIAAGERRVRELTEQHATELARVNEDAHQQIISAQRDAAVADQRAGSLRDQARALAARCGAGAKGAAAPSPGQAASNPADVLADLFARADARAGELARIADERGIAGAACERAYQVNEPVNSNASQVLHAHDSDAP